MSEEINKEEIITKPKKTRKKATKVVKETESHKDLTIKSIKSAIESTKLLPNSAAKRNALSRLNSALKLIDMAKSK